MLNVFESFKLLVACNIPVANMYLNQFKHLFLKLTEKKKKKKPHADNK